MKGSSFKNYMPGSYPHFCMGLPRCVGQFYHNWYSEGCFHFLHWHASNFPCSFSTTFQPSTVPAIGKDFPVDVFVSNIPTAYIHLNKLIDLKDFPCLIESLKALLEKFWFIICAAAAVMDIPLGVLSHTIWQFRSNSIGFLASISSFSTFRTYFKKSHINLKHL